MEKIDKTEVLNNGFSVISVSSEGIEIGFGNDNRWMSWEKFADNYLKKLMLLSSVKNLASDFRSSIEEFEI